jgi:2-phospho-L-lactate guanylyltransferase
VPVIVAIVPVKALPAAKSRLVPHLGRAGARQLTLAMLRDVVEALVRVPALAKVVVVTPDEQVARTARESGAEALLRPDPGLNAAVDAACAELAPGDGALVVLGDVAGLRAGEIDALLAALPDPGPAGGAVALAPSGDGGTSALLRVPADAIPAAFGAGSAKRHVELAERAGVPHREPALASLAVDVDEPEDLDALRRAGALGPHTAACLEALGLPG